MISATAFSGLAFGQQYGSGYYGGGYDGSAGYTGGGNVQQAPYADGFDGSVSISGLEGLQGFSQGQNLMSLAIQPIHQQNALMYFQVVGFAITNPHSGQSVAYALNKPLPGVADPSQNTMQIDISRIGIAVSQAGYVDAARVYDVLRIDPSIMIIDLEMSYAGTQGLQTFFDVYSITMIPPDGRAQTFQMQQPTRLVIDAMAYRICMVTFPQMINFFGGFFGPPPPALGPVILGGPVLIPPPIFVPVLVPIPILFAPVPFVFAFPGRS
jgi:hypothetical protein